MVKKTDTSAEFIYKFIEFCNDDLKTAALVDQLRYKITYFIDLLGERESRIGRMSEADWHVFVKYQEKCHEFLEWFFEHRYKDIYLYYKVPHAFLMAGKDKAKSYVLLKHGNPASEMVWDANMEFDRVGEEIDYKIIAKPGMGGDVVRKKFPRSSLEFLNAIKNYPVESLDRCPTCKNLFFNHTKRKKIYCSLQCQNTAAVHRLRGKEKKS